ncbi:hypothetical protein ACFL67_01485 [candidate division KSB1 bacterium]
MSKKKTVSVSHLISMVVDGCGKNDPAMVGNALRSLIAMSGQSKKYSADYLRLFRLCYYYLQAGQIDEIRKTFERLSSGWIAAVVSAVTEHELESAMDVEIEAVSIEAYNLSTKDPVVARRLLNMKGTRLDMIDKIPSGRTTWNFVVNRRWLSRTLNKLRRPQYWEFLDRNKSRQLKLEF